MITKNFDELQPKIALGIVAHPDDLEFGAAGTFAKWIAAGTEAYYLILTDGSKGSADPKISTEELIEIRRDEQRVAAQVLGLKDVFFLDYPDGMLEITMDLKRDIVRVIRQIKPDVVVTMDPSMIYTPSRGLINHPDHRAAGQAVLDAVFPLARDHLSFPEIYAEGLAPHKTSHILLINFNQPNYVVDISETIDTKIATLQAHVSQMPAGPKLKENVHDWATYSAVDSACSLAECYVRIDIT